MKKLFVICFLLCALSGIPLDVNGAQVIIQPGPEGKDTFYGTAYYTSGSPDNNHLDFGGWGDAYYDYIEFDLTNAPAANLVVTAKLYLYTPSAPPSDPGLTVNRITQSWTEAGVSYNSNPASVHNKTMDPIVTGWNVVDITSLYKDWKNNVYPNYGIKLAPQQTWNTNSIFYSSDYTDDPSLRPMLVIETSVASASIFEIQDFRFDYGGSTIFYDDFADGSIPAIPPYNEVQGSVGMSESGGGLKMDTALATPFLGGTTRIPFSAGAVGYVQGVFRDNAPLAEEGFSISIGNSDLGGAIFSVWNSGGNTFLFFNRVGEPGIALMPISGFTGNGTITLRLSISDSDTSDGLFEVQPTYWFNSGVPQSISAIIQLPLVPLMGNSYPAYFSSGSYPAFIPGDFAGDCDVDGSDLAALIANTSLVNLATFAQNFGKNTCQ